MDTNDLVYSTAVLVALLIAGTVCVAKTSNTMYFIPMVVYIVAGYFFPGE